MTTQVDSETQQQSSQALLPAESFADESVESTESTSTTPPAKISSLSDPRMAGVRFTRGFLLGIGLEVVLVLLLYGLWLAWRLFR